MRHLLHTNVLSEVARPDPNERVVAWLKGQHPLDLAISVLTIGEIQRVVSMLSNGRRRTNLEHWLATDLPRQFHGRILGVDATVALEWGRLSGAGRRSGRDLPVVDGLLLATASVYELTFVTRNESDCAERGVPLVNPWRR
jgi:predicted nucleic acid-binding protein